MSDVRYKITADSTGAVKSVKKLDKEIDKMPSTAKKAQKGMKNLWLQVGAGMVAAQGAMRAVKGLIKFMGETVEAAKIQEKAEKSLEAALKTTGREITKNSKHYKRYASAIQRVTMFGDEEILKSQALLLQLTDLSQNGIDKATEAAVGLATVYDQDLSAATTLVGKALAGNYGALSRYGIQVEKTLSDEEKKASILEQLATMYDRAKEEANSFTGIQKQISDIWGDMKEQLGNVIVKNEDLRKSMSHTKEVMEALRDSGAIEDTTNNFIEAAKITAKYHPILAQLSFAMKPLANQMNKIVEAAKAKTEAMENAIPNMEVIAQWTKTYGVNLQFAVKWLERLTEEQEGAGDAGKEYVYVVKDMINKLPDLTGGVKALNEHLEEQMGFWANLGDEIDPWILKAQELTTVHQDLGYALGELIPKQEQVMQALKALDQEFMSEIQRQAVMMRQTIMNIFQSINALSGQFYQNQMTRIDNEETRRQDAIESWYEQQKKRIMDSIKDEDKREEALKKLEEERAQREGKLQEDIEQKKKEIQRKAAQRNKEIATVQAIMNTADAVTKALGAAFPPLNYILAGVVGAMGAAQVSLIRSQPLPLAKGGILEGPTTFLAGEAGKEAIIPLEGARGKQIIKEVFKETNKPINISLRAYIGQTELKKLIIKTVEKETRLGNLKIASKSVQ